MPSGWPVLVGYPQPMLQGTAVANSASIPKFEHHFSVPDLIGGGIPLTGGLSQEYGWGMSRILSRVGSGLPKGCGGL